MTPTLYDTTHSLAKTSFFDTAFFLIRIEQKHPSKEVKTSPFHNFLRLKRAFYDKYFLSYDIFHKNDVIFTFNGDVGNLRLKVYIFPMIIWDKRTTFFTNPKTDFSKNFFRPTLTCMP